MRLVRYLLVVSIVLCSTMLYAQATRTWVSGVGDDANPCSRTAPCKTFAGAISKTAAGGEISVLDPGGYGAVNITKSMTIDGNGQISSILASGTNGVIVNAATTDRVYLRNLTINGGGTGLNGIRIIAAASVAVENCAIFNFSTAATSDGIEITNTTAPVRVDVHNTTIRNVGGSGIFAATGAGQESRISISNSRFFDNGRSGVNLESNSKAIMMGSMMDNNSQAGVYLETASTEIHVFNSVLSRNAHGVFVGDGGGGTVRLYGTQITQNTANGISINGAAIVSTHGNNAIVANVGGQATNNNAGLQ